MADINVCTFTGRLVTDVEVIVTPTAKRCAKFVLANDDWLGKNKGKGVYFPEFICWSENIVDYLAKWGKKGMRMTVASKYTENKWEDKNGQKRKSVVFVVDNFMLTFEQKKENPIDNPENSQNIEGELSEVADFPEYEE